MRFRTGLCALFFGLTAAVDPRLYITVGVSLMALKYLVEALVFFYATGDRLAPWQFLDPVLLHRLVIFSKASPALAWGLLLWTVPFIWIGLSMSMRRARDAGRHPALGLLFLVPYLNYLAMLTFAVWPTRDLTRHPDLQDPDDLGLPIAGPLLAGILSVAVAGLMVVLCIYGLRDYGSSLFVLTPVVMGFVNAVVLNGRGDQGLSRTAAQGQLALLVAMLGMLAVAVEGAICLAMAWPLAAVMVWIGGLLGYAFGRPQAVIAPRVRRVVPLLAVLLPPLVAWNEARDQRVPLREVSSAVEVDAPPEVVWRHVVSFPDLPPPDGVFATGIACPLRARIAGSGVGAVRSCEFTTGPFVEPITAWDEPRRLAFAVTAQPPTMRELSPWGDIHPPHLDGYLRSRRGEFRLVPLDGGRRTRLEGSTWYELQVSPGPYWHLWGDGLIHAIHARVLEHIRRLAEGEARR
jgi:hypothetical protein